jgi:hypothetical protein
MTNLGKRTWPALGLALLAALPLSAQTPSLAPGVAVLDFDNGALVRNTDYGPLGKGIADMLIADLIGNTSMRIVEREQLQRIIQEHDLVKDGRVDEASAVRAGKLVGARYFLTGGFIVDGSGTMVLTVRAINVETSELPYTAKVEGKSENVLRLIGELATKVNTGLKLPPLAAGRPTEASRPSRGTEVSAQDQYRAFYLVSRSIEEQDKKNYTAAMALLRQALDVYPNYERARTRLASLERIGG